MVIDTKRQNISEGKNPLKRIQIPFPKFKGKLKKAVNSNRSTK